MLNDTILSGFTKTYTDKIYRHTAAIRHKGTVIVFAMDDQRRIWYAALNTNPTAADGSPTPSPFDVNNWPAGPAELSFPNEIAEVGFGVADQVLLPAFQNGSRAPATPGTRLDRRDKDFFLSTTARFTAAAPFQVLTDGRYVYIFRQAIDNQHADMVWVDKAGHLITSTDGSKDKMGYWEKEVFQQVYQKKNGKLELAKPENGEPAPLVNSTLLVDRFVLMGTQLQPRLEVRFQRSRSKTRPQSRKDSLGAKDLDGNNFYEPTQELRFVGNLNKGRFAAILLPTSVAGVERWQIFTQNAHTGRIDSFNVERSADGLFNTRGSQESSNERYAESALHFEKNSDHVALNQGVTLGERYTQEAWIFPAQTQSVEPQALFTGDSADKNGAPSVWIEAQTRLRVGFGDGQKWHEFSSRSILTPNAWNHVAVVFDGAAFRFYVGGNLREKIDLPEAKKPVAAPVNFFGAAQKGFTGILDEVRFWNRVRSARELQADKNQRLTGLEPGLAGYWRFDEGEGDTVFDQTNNGSNGILHGGKWITSDAPIGENTGVNRGSFQVVDRKSDGNLEARSVESGLTALLYFQQANVASGYDGKEKPLKQNARVMLAVATKGTAADDKPHIAALDFGVSTSGRIAQIPDNVALSLLNPPDAANTSINDKLDKISSLQNEIRLLDLDIDRLTEKIGGLPAAINVLTNALNDPASFTADIADKNFKYLNPKLHALKKAGADLEIAEYQKQRLDDAVNAARVTVYEDDSFRGKTLTFGLGFVNDNALGDLNNEITGLSIGNPLRVRAYDGANRSGESIVFRGTIGNVGGDWNDRISSMDIEENPNHADVRAFANNAFTTAKGNFDKALVDVHKELGKLQAKIVPLQQEKSAKESLRSAAQLELSNLQFDLQNGASVTMPLVHLDPFGLSVSGGLLGFAWTTDTPLLFDSATGTLALYFRGGDDQFFAAYFNTFTEKAKYPLSDKFKIQSVLAVARSSDLDMDKLVVEVSGDENSTTCTVTIEGARIKEIWKKMPRNPVGLSRVLNGEAGHYSNNKLVGYREFIGFASFVKNGNELTLNAPEGIRRALEIGADLMIGETRATVLETAQNQATVVKIESAAPVLPSGKLPVFFMEYDYAANASTTKVPGDLFGGSLLLRAVPLPNSKPVSNQRVTGGATITSAWIAAGPGSTLTFDGENVFAKAPTPVDLKKFDIQDDVTLEAWVRPNGVEEGKSRVAHHRSDDSAYTLGLLQKDLMSALEFNGSNYVELGLGIELGTVFTQEAWIYPSPTNDDFHGFLGNQPDALVTNRAPSLWVVRKTKIHGGFSDGTNWNSFTTDSVLLQDDWNHVAATFDGNSYKVFVNGRQVFETEAFKNKIPAAVPVKFIGKVDNFFQGKIDDVRLWKRARTQQEILADMNRRLDGNETDLVGYWHFENKTARDFSRNNNNGVLQGNPVQAVSALPAYSVFAGVNGKFVETKAIFPAGNWTHLAAAFAQSYGLKFDGASGYMDCGKDESLNINTDLTLEVFLQTSGLNQEQTLIARGEFGRFNGQYPPYALLVDSSGHLVFAFEDLNGQNYSFKTTAAIQPGKSCQVMATRKRRSLSGTNGSVTTTFAWDDIALSIDGVAENFKYTSSPVATAAIEKALNDDTFPVVFGLFPPPPDVGRSDLPTIIGRNFKGIISEVRVWNKSLEASAANLQGQQNGLVSWWRFEEREGNQAKDSKSQNHATINGNVKWTKDPDTSRSGLTLYANDGDPLPTVPRSAADFVLGEKQFALGGLPNGSELFQGELEEVRIWKTWRTPEQIQDNLFRRLNGELDDLIAYYTFDAEKDNKLGDNALRGNHLTVQGGANYILSTAPVSDDAPQVRSALAGIRTPFSGQIHSAPAVQEYGDIQTDGRGNMIGVFKRCYGLVKNGNLQLITGFKVGDLVTEWIGQVQFAPELKGFIEGAPPVPSENLTQPSVEMIGDLDDYNEASKIELLKAQETTYTYSASKAQSFGLEVDLALKFGIKSESDFGAGIGAFTITKIEESKAMVGIKAHFEAMWGWSEEASAGVGRTTGESTSIELRGRYTSPEENENEPFGRRFVPDNTGLALVQSETADVFALRLKHNNALISFSMRPNPDIPKDWNIISFPLNPRYIKQGTLDGKIGPNPDPDYPNAFEYSSDVSYFKPVEAYALKNKIRRQETQLETYYSQFDAKGKGQKAYFPSASALELAEYSELQKILHRNIVNTYVWTSDGGLFAETQQNREFQTETTSGNYEFKGAVGIDVNIGFHIVKVGAIFELSAMFIGQHQLSVSKSKESETSFELNVSVDKVERDIYKRDERKVVITDNSDPLRPKPVKSPYKVDAYRFMTFYLEPESDNFDLFFSKVVDPIWLEQGDEPAAAALREARQKGTKPPCWRIMHRVTYVSRILPPLDNFAPPSLEKSLQTLDIDSNYELIKQLEPYVSNRLTSFPEFADAVRETIEQNLPELRPHTGQVIQYMSLYFGIADGQMPDDERFGESTLLELAPNQPPIVNAGLDQIIGLDGASVAADLEAVVIDDRLEKAEAIFVSWEKIAGEGDVIFEKPHEAKTKATFTKRGRYILRCTANDGLLSANDEVIIVVDERPVISAGVDQEIFALAANSTLEALLAGLILNNGLGDPDFGGLNRMTVNWSKSSPLGDAIFSNKNALDTKATFATRGHYLLKLSVSNGTFTADDEILIAVAARSTKQLQALYTFEENGGNTVRDVSGAGAPLDLLISDPAAVSWKIGALELKSPALLATVGAATRLSEAIKSSGEITLEAWVKPSSLSVDGLTRLVTLSGGATTRNFTLGQSGNNFHLNLRSSTTNDNASNKALTGGDTANELTHLVCTRDPEGFTRLYVNGLEVASRVVNGDFSTWDNNFRLALGNEIGATDGIARAWSGTYHLVAIYSRALGEQEVLQNFQFGADANLPPIAYSGENQIIDWQNIAQPKIIVALQGRVANDRPQETLNIQWAQVSGPGNPDGVVFQNKNQPITTAEFSQKGRYALRLTADDGQLMTSSETTVIVHRPPTVTLKTAAQKIALAGTSVTADLIAEVPDDGWGDDMNPTQLTCKWSRISGPDTLQISDSDKLQTKATFSARGFYRLKLEVSNGRLTTVSEFAVTINQKPVVNAGPNQIGTLPASGINPFIQLNINGQATDTGLGNPADKLNFKWEQVSGPKGGMAEFGDATKLQTTAKFTVGGVYVLRLVATNPDNPELTASSEMTITANRAPVVDIGPDPAPLLLKLPSQLSVTTLLDATVSDDGLPDPPGIVSLKWSKVSGPANVTFTPDNNDYTEAKFVQKGKYILRLEANDGAATASDQATIIVNTPPVVKAGPQQKVTVTGNEITLQLKGEIVDKGLGDETPQSVVATKWEKKSGSGNPAFANASALETAVTLPNQKGVYVLQLSADNGSDVGVSTVQIVVNQPPVVETFVFETDPPANKKRLLSVQVQTDGLGNPQQDVLTFSWKKVAGTGQATFVPDPNNELQTVATFSTAGSYTLELTVGNGSGFTVKKTVGVMVG